ncbi:MAG: hypothetical protein GXY44_05500 [Phycisphaerales bacterium]|nr:hypothetical protein [Phycisphaerales bacterium]
MYIDDEPWRWRPACDGREFAKILATGEPLYADGVSVVWASRWLGQPLPQRLSAADYFETFAKRCAAAIVLKKRSSDLKMAGTHKGFFRETEWEAVIARPDIPLIGWDRSARRSYRAPSSVHGPKGKDWGV